MKASIIFIKSTVRKLFFISLLFFSIINGLSAQKTDSLYVQSLVKMADDFDEKALYEDAKSMYYETISAAEKIEDWDVICYSYGRIAFIVSDSTNGVEKAIRIVEKAEEIAINNAPENHRSRIELMFVKGIINIENGNFEIGKNLFEEGMQLSLDENIVDHDLNAKIQYNLGNVAMREGRYKDSFQHYKKSGNYYSLDGDLLNAAQCLNACGYTNVRMGHYDIGISYYNQSIIKHMEILNSENDEVELVYRNIGGAYLEQKKYAKALVYFEKSVALAKKLYGPNALGYGRAYFNVGAYFMELGEYEKALEIYQIIEPIYDLHLVSNHPSHGILNFNLGDIYAGLHMLDSSLVRLNQAYGVFEHSFGKSSYQCLLTQAKIANVDSQLGNYDNAIASIKEVIEISGKVLGAKNDVSVKSLEILASIYTQLGEHDKTISVSQKGLISTSNNFNQVNFDLNPSGADIVYLGVAINFLSYKIEALYHLGVEKNDNLYFKKAISASKDAQSIYDHFRRDIGRGFELNSSTLKSFANINDVCIKSIQKLLIEKNATTKYDVDLYTTLEYRKSIFLMDAIRGVEASLLTNIPDSIQQKQAYFNELIISLESKIRKLEQAGNREEAEAIKSDSLFYSLRQRESFEALIESKYKSYFDLKYQSAILNQKAFNSLLYSDELFLSFTINEFSDELVIAVAEKGREMEFVFQEIDNIDLVEKISTLSRLLLSNTLIRPKKKSEFISTSYELYNLFIDPIKDRLIGKNRLIIVGEGVSNFLPFEVLLPSAINGSFEDLDFLVKNHEISYHNSGNLLANSRLSQPPNYSDEILAFAPVFGQQDSTSLIGSEYRFVIDSTLSAFRDNEFSPLYYSEKEVKEIERLFLENDKKANILTYQKADEANLKTQLEKGYKYVHIASHSFSNLNNPKFSGIACAQLQGERLSEDGILHVGEIYNLDVPADLVVLSSCESGIGKLVTGEGMMGINRSFVYAGVPNVVFSLWKVNDKTTSQLMVEFYKNILAGNDYSAALRNAKLEMLKNKATASPNLWAAFLLVGR